MKATGKKPIWRKLLILLAVAVLIKLFSFFGGWVEALYSTGIYPVIAVVFRFFTGWLTISLGDLLYAAAVIWLVVRLVKLAKLLFQRKSTWQGFWAGLGRTAAAILWIYILFNGLWGLNYDRYGISYQLKLKPNKYSTDELKHLTTELVQRVNASRTALGDSNFTYPPDKEIFAQAETAYDSVVLAYPFLKYTRHSVKRSLYSEAGNYFGFLGYYNPFTGEAQVNTAVPAFVIPYTACHEIAHQLGYGSESEANFVGYLSAKASNNNIFHYSVYFDMFSYANNELFFRDSAAARNNYRLLDTLVKQDYRAYRKFLLAHKNPIEPVISMFYGEYLKANKQPKGIETYNEVVAWLIAYEKKYGPI